MDCARAEELLSDHMEGTLGDVLRHDLEEHLDVCANCRELTTMLAEAVAALRSHPVLAPSAGLAERAAALALFRSHQVESQAPATKPWPRPAGFQLLAAALALAFTGLVVFATSPSGPASRSGARLLERTLSAGTYVVERADRLFEDVRILRVVISTAFQGRLDRVNDRLDDYRRLLERRRTPEQEPAKSNGAHADGGGVLTAWAPLISQNSRDTGLVPRKEA